MRVVVLVNAGAGSVGEAEKVATGDAVAAAFARAGADASIRAVPGADLADEAARIASQERPDAVVAAGGDGTIGTVAGALAGTDATMGVMPLGTFNHFAKLLGIPVDLDEAAAALVGGTVRQVDVAEVNGRVFVNNSVVGAYPSMVSIRERIAAKRGWGKVRAVPVAMTRVLREFPVHRLDLTSPEGFTLRQARTPMLFIGNGVYQNPGGGTGDRESITDGLLGVAVAHTVSRWALVRVTIRALVAGVDRVDEVDLAEVRELTVTARTRRLLVALDGEVCRMATPLRYRSRPGALRVLVPARPDDPR